MKSFRRNIKAVLSVLKNDAELEASFKGANKHIIPPGITLVGAYFLILEFSHTPQWYIGLFFGLLPMIINPLMVYASEKNRIFSYPMRDDIIDVSRTIITMICCDVPLFLVLKPSPIVLVSIWFVLSVGFFFEPFKFAHRVIISLLSIVTSSISVYLITGASLGEVLFFALCKLCIIVWFWAIQYLWLQNVHRSMSAEKRAMRFQKESEYFYRNAIIGEHSKTITHEVGNLMMIIDLATKNPDQVDLPAVRASLKQIGRLNDLVLADLKTGSSRRIYPINDFIDEIELLLAKAVRKMGYEWRSQMLKTHLCFIEERSGSLYFILQNIVRNSLNAIQNKSIKSGVVTFSVEIDADAGRVLFKLRDNGGGMSPSYIESIVKRTGVYRSNGGHGLGMKFIMAECDKNKFGFDVNSDGSTYTETTISVPLMSTDSEHFTILRTEPQAF